MRSTCAAIRSLLISRGSRSAASLLAAWALLTPATVQHALAGGGAVGDADEAGSAAVPAPSLPPPCGTFEPEPGFHQQCEGSGMEPWGEGAASDAVAPFYEDFQSYPEGDWEEGSFHGPWFVQFLGEGHARITGGDTPYQQLELRPRAEEGTTHATLVTTTRQFRNLDVSLDVATVEQLHAEPAAWEAAWVLWNYLDNCHFYYVILKPPAPGFPGGWELGQEWADDEGDQRQRFMLSGPGHFPVGTWQRLRIQQRDNVISVYVGDELLGSCTDTYRPYDRGALGLYTEDARVQFDTIEQSY